MGGTTQLTAKTCSTHQYATRQPDPTNEDGRPSLLHNEGWISKTAKTAMGLSLRTTGKTLMRKRTQRRLTPEITPMRKLNGSLNNCGQKMQNFKNKWRRAKDGKPPIGKSQTKSA